MAGSGVLARVGAIRGLPGVLLGSSAFVVAEYAEWVAILVYAYDRGGATEAGLVALAQLVPAALAAAVLARWLSRFRPARVLQAAYAVLAVVLVACGVGVLLDLPALAYGAAIVSALPMVVPRPAQVATLPLLSDDPRDLAIGSVALGWADSIGVVGAGLLAGVVLTASGPGWLVLSTAALAVGSLVATIPVDRATRATADRLEERGGPTSGPAVPPPASEPVPWRSARVLVALLAVEGVLVASLDVLFVVLAVDVLERGEGWAGYLQMAFGLGAVASAMVTARLVDRRLAPPVIAASLVTGAALALTAPGPGLVVTVAVVAIAGVGRAVLDVSTRTLLLRITPHGATAQVFGVVEGFMMGGLALGSLFVPALVAIGGPATALLGAAALLPVAVAATFVRLVRLDAEAPDHRRTLAALRTSTVFAHLPRPALEELAGAAAPRRFAAGATLIREGDPGLDYHLIIAGEVEVSQGGRLVGRVGPGEGVGEIALIRRVPRTATVTALTAVETLRLDGPAFLEAIARGATTS